jgi:hypothetical protein
MLLHNASDFLVPAPASTDFDCLTSPYADEFLLLGRLVTSAPLEREVGTKMRSSATVSWVLLSREMSARQDTMQPHNRKKLNDRVVKAAEAALAAQKYASAIDVLVGIGWLDPGTVKCWRQGQVGYLEGAIQTNLPRISEAMKLFRSRAGAKGLIPSETAYIARAPSPPQLRFSKSGKPSVEKLYRTHWISPELSEKQAAARCRAREPSARACGDPAVAGCMDVSPLRRHG